MAPAAPSNLALYRFNFKASRKKAGALNMTFKAGAITKIKMRPPNHPSPKVIPVHKYHLKNVFDPLSAIAKLTLANNGKPCDQRLRVFDGKLRFDLDLHYLRKSARPASPESAKSANLAIICGVKFIAVAGHKKDKNTKRIEQTRGIEIWLRPVPEANIYITHQVRVPTVVGDAVLSARRIEILSDNNRQIALVN